MASYKPEKLEEQARRGRPPKFETPEQMQILIDKYFEDCKGEYIKDKDGNVLLNKWGDPVAINRTPPTVTGLALALGFTSRLALLNYESKDEAFLNTVKRAKARVEAYAETRLYDKDGALGAKFALGCNFPQWSDKLHIDATNINVNADIEDVSKMDPATRQRLIRELLAKMSENE